MYLVSLASLQPSFSCRAITASIFVFCSGVRLRLANETSQAIFPCLFPTCFVQSPCSPANIMPATKSPATANAISLVIVGNLDGSAAVVVQNLLRALSWRLIGSWQKNQSHKLQHRGDKMDDDPGEERPKPIPDCDVVELQQNRSDSDGKERKEQHLVYAFEFDCAKLAHGGEIKDRKWELTKRGHSAAPSPDRCRRRPHREQKNPDDSVGQRQD